MKFVTVTALRDFQYNGREIALGSVVSMNALDAAIYRRRHLISASRHPGLNRESLTPDPEPQAPAIPQPVPAPKPARGRRKYRRRDLIAEEP